MAQIPPINKLIIYQMVIMIILFFYSWFWYGQPSLGFTVTSTILTTFASIFFDYIWFHDVFKAAV